MCFILCFCFSEHDQNSNQPTNATADAQRHFTERSAKLYTTTGTFGVGPVPLSNDITQSSTR